MTLLSRPIALTDASALPPEPKVAAATPRPVAPPVVIHQRPRLTVAILLLTDLLAVLTSITCFVLLWHAVGGDFSRSFYLRVGPLLLLFPLVFYFGRLYSVPLHPAEELRRIVTCVLGTYVALATAVFLLRQGEVWSRGIFVLAALGSAAAVPLARALMRMALAHRPGWGWPVLVVGSGPGSRRLIRHLLRQPGLGLKPVGLVDDRPWRARSFPQVPFLGSTDMAGQLARRYPALRVVVVPEELPVASVRRLIRQEHSLIRHLILVPQVLGVQSVGVRAHDLGGTLTLEVQHRLLDPRQVWIKRGLELLLILLALPVLLPLMAVIALAVRLDSRGPVFYRQQRLGRGGRPFHVIKFRTMAVDADRALQAYLASDPMARREWERHQKLVEDPRITRVGRWLRHTSLDELPQLLNVLAGQMALVGPRPIIAEEIPRYGNTWELLQQAPAGITGLWQVSGRNQLTYPERVALDAYYIRNWSVWLDLYILARTVVVVLSRKGAY